MRLWYQNSILMAYLGYHEEAAAVLLGSEDLETMFPSIKGLWRI